MRTASVRHVQADLLASGGTGEAQRAVCDNKPDVKKRAESSLLEGVGQRASSDTAEPIRLTLPWPPSVNTYWRHISKGPLAGRTLISEKGRDYRKTVCDLVRSQPGLKCRLAVVIDAFPPDRRRRDLDNITKSLLDALDHAGVYEDDSQIDDLHLRRMAVHKPGKVEVVISPATMQAAA